MGIQVTNYQFKIAHWIFGALESQWNDKQIVSIKM